MSSIPAGAFKDAAKFETAQIKRPDGQPVKAFASRADSLVAIREKVIELDDANLLSRLGAMESRLEEAESFIEAVKDRPF